MKKRQKAIYEYIGEYIENNSYPPTIREIAEGVGLSSPATVHGHLSRLKNKGFVDFEPTRPRTLRLIK